MNSGDRQWMVRQRQQGKTVDIIEWIRQGEPRTGRFSWSRILLVPTRQDLASLASRHPFLVEDSWKVMTFQEVQRCMRGSIMEVEGVEFAMDDLDRWLSETFGSIWSYTSLVSVTGVTSVTRDEETPDPA